MDAVNALVVAEPYLGSELAGLTLLLGLIRLAGPERGRMLLAGAMLLPVLPAVPLLDADYWVPRRLGGLPVGIEDVLYVVQIGAAAWFFATRAGHFEPNPAAGGRIGMRRLALLMLAALPVWTALAVAWSNWSDALLVTVLTVGLALLARRPDQLAAALTGGIGTALWFGVQLRLWNLIWPELPGWWSPGTWTSTPVLGVPIGDLAYAGVIGAVHPLALATLLDGRFVRRRGAQT